LKNSLKAFIIGILTFLIKKSTKSGKYDTNRIKENELNLSASYAFSESLATSLLYVNVDTETSLNDEPDYDKWIATIEYTF
ncbi:hypothetical protein L5F65_10235, partial [Aliarcobacter butzleri]|nr:hypothetical protein [Aliarcobacter butzleri]